MKNKFKPIKFPEDESAHNHIIEWWYFNGHLKDKDGNQYSFMNCLFKADNKKVNIPFLRSIPFKTVYFFHSIISDIKRKKTYPSINDISIISQDSFSKPLLYINHTNPIIINGYVNRVIEKTNESSYILKDEYVDLKMTSVKKPLLEGGEGYINVHSKKSYYYSLTNLKTEGRIKINNKWLEVSGKSWMDHQWANAAYTQDKWSWFSIQLDNGIEMVCYEYDDKKVKTRLASISYKNGEGEHYTKINLIPTGKSWQSPKTKAEYPTSWNIIVPEKNINLIIEPLLNKQEVIFGSINYWEGPTFVKGKFEGENVSGDGYMELVGYPSKYRNIDFVEDQIIKTAKDFISVTKKYIKHK